MHTPLLFAAFFTIYLAESAMMPPHQRVEGNDNCLDEQPASATHTEVCLPKEKPTKCTDEAWDQLSKIRDQNFLKDCRERHQQQEAEGEHAVTDGEEEWEEISVSGDEMPPTGGGEGDDDLEQTGLRLVPVPSPNRGAPSPQHSSVQLAVAKKPVDKTKF